MQFHRLDVKQSLELLEVMSCVQHFKEHTSLLDIVQVLDCNPMAVALAASTIRHYCSIFPASSSEAEVVATYRDLLTRSLKEKPDVLRASLDLYYEAAVSDPRFRHTFDLLGCCDLDYPILTSVLPTHLSMDFYGISSESLAPPPLNPMSDKLKTLSAESYWDQVKAMVPFFRKKQSDKDVVDMLVASQDEISFLRESPIFSFQRGDSGDVEFIAVHSLAAPQLSQLFLRETVTKLDQDHLLKEIKEFEQSAWFKQYRTFDTKKSLENFHRKLPGLSLPGILTEAQFDSDKNSGTLLSRTLTYPQYLHLVSHYHRVVSSLVTSAQSSKGEVTTTVTEKSLVPHLQMLKLSPCLSSADQLSLDISLVSIKALSEKCVEEYNNLIAKQKGLLGDRSVDVAHSLVDLADLYLSVNNASTAKQHLLCALEIYQKVPAHKYADLTLRTGHALSSLALACGQMNEFGESRKFYEQALATAQSVPVSGSVSLKQRRLVSNLLVDVTRAYLCLGELTVAKKYGELAEMMLQSVYPQGHAETVRLLNIRSITSSLMGDKEGSVKCRTEASKIKSKISHVY